MDILGIWYALTLLGTPEYWALSAMALTVIYFVLRYLIPENRTWKKLRPGFKGFLLIFIPSILIFFGVTILLKAIAYIPRPCVPCNEITPLICNPFCGTDSSFPSGHAGTIFVVFSSLYLTLRKRSFLPLFILPVLISYSRIALGVHTWIDVLAGAFLGLAIPFLVSIIIQKWHKLK